MTQVLQHVGRYITGYYGCKCHPFASWPECDKAHKQKLKVGQIVRHRCQGSTGVVHEDTDRLGFCLVKYGPQPRDIVSEHVANLVPSSIQLNIFPMDKKLTQLQEFALEQLKLDRGDLTANQLAARWARHKKGHVPVSSRSMFGYTSAGYRCLRDLAKKGLVIDNGRYFHLKHN